MEESAVPEKSIVKDGLVSLFLSTLMYELNLSTFLFAAPLMIFAIRHKKNRAMVLFGLEALIVIALEVFRHFSALNDSIKLLALVFSLAIPLSLLAAGAIWLYTEKHKLLVRILLSLLPVCVISGLLLVFYAVDVTLFEGLYDYYKNAFASSLGELLGKVLGEDLDYEMLFSLIASCFLSLVLPFLTLAVCATSFIYETGLHSRESDFEDRVAGYEFPTDFVWTFIISLALLLLFHFVSAVPLALMVVIMNLTGLFTVLYSIQGFTVVYARLRRRMMNLKSMTLFIILFIVALVVPGINFIVIFGLPLLGLLESFFDLKKLGVKNEDHS